MGAARRRHLQRTTIAGLVAAIAMVAAALAASMAFGDDDGDEARRPAGGPARSAPTVTAEPPSSTAPSSTSSSTAPPAPGTVAPPTTFPEPAPTTAGPSSTPPPTTTAPGQPGLESDLDGDGILDAVSVQRDASAGLVQLRVDLSSIGVREVEVETPTVRLVAVMGAVDVDGDERSELFVRTTAGASTVFGSLFRLDGDSLVRVAFEGVGPQFAVHGGVRQLAGLRCVDGGVELSSAVSDDGTSYQVSSLRYEPSEDAEVFALRSQETATVTADEVHSEVDCGSLPRHWSPGAK